jgi:hypothetical protein
MQIGRVSPVRGRVIRLLDDEAASGLETFRE